MVETAIISALAVPAVVLAYIGFRLKDRHSSIKMVMVATSLVFLIGVPFTGWQIALENGYASIADYMLGFVLASIIVFVLFTFYSIWLYIKAAALVTSGSEEAFDQDEV